MKTIALIGLILAATASMGIASETSMTIQNNSTIRIDPITGHFKGDAQTQIRGIRRPHEALAPVTLPSDMTTPTSTGAAATPVNLTTPTDPNAPTTPVNLTTPTDPTAVATPVSVASPTGLDAVTTPVGAAPPTSPDPTCPFQPVVGGQQN